jgi:hypothetical protein
MWIITRDIYGEEGCYAPELRETDRVGVHSRDYNAEGFAKADTLPIRLLDDDGELVFEASATRERILKSAEERAFEILDWAMADAGCTELQYCDNGEWQTL